MLRETVSLSGLVLHKVTVWFSGPCCAPSKVGLLDLSVFRVTVGLLGPNVLRITVGLSVLAVLSVTIGL